MAVGCVEDAGDSMLTVLSYGARFMAFSTVQPSLTKPGINVNGISILLRQGELSKSTKVTQLVKGAKVEHKPSSLAQSPGS